MEIVAKLNEQDKKCLGEEIGSAWNIERPENLDDDELRRRLYDVLVYPPKKEYECLNVEMIKEEDLQEIYKIARKTVVKEMRNYIDKMKELWNVD